MSVFGLKRERSSPPSSGRLASIRSSAAALRMRLPPLALAYAIPSLFAAAAVQTWFTSGTVLAGGDQVPPLATDTDYAAHWSHEDGGEGAPSYTIISLPYVEGLRAAAWVGLGEPMFQRLWLTAIVAGAVAAVVYLARGIGVSPLGATVAGFV